MKAKFHGEPFRDFKEKKWLITFETEEAPENYDRLKEKLLTLEVKEYRQKRTLNANAYFHCLVGKIAEALGVSHIEVHNRMIVRYGVLDEDIATIIMRDDIPYEKIETLHLCPTQSTRVLDDGKLYRVYIVKRGSHTYDTKEMATLIDGTVTEAKELGIETLPPAELERMVNSWKAC